MSLVGPRPALEYELEHYDERHFDRFSVRPGMTGLWQVSGRNRLGFNEMLDLDVEYARTTGFLLDVKILAKTPMAAVSGAA
jgi:lipopolysaccharide/colanic/teichoic acid biosynthesis glycosyltransferase